MCGIFAYLGQRDDAASLVFSGLKDLEYRGYDSWGLAALDVTNQSLFLHKQVGKLPPSPPPLPPSHLACGHTRWATHGGVTQANAHPHLSPHQKVVVVHNGIIENFLDLRKSLPHHRFRSQTDTEVVAHLIEKKLARHTFLVAAAQTFSLLQGYNTIVALSPQTQEIVAFKKGSPLVIGQTPDGYFLSSDIPALLSFTKQIYTFQDGQGVYLSPQGAFLLTVSPLTLSPLSFQKVSLPSFQSDHSPSRFSHHLLQEIFDQGQVLQRIASFPISTFQPLLHLLTSSSRLFLTGCGTAGHAALAGRYLLARSGILADFIVGSEFAHFAPLLNSHSLVIATSQSGETIDTLEAIRLAKSRQAKTAALVNVPASTLTQEVDYTIYLSAGRERAVVSTKAYTAKLAIFLLLSTSLKSKRDFLETQKLISQTASHIQDFFSPSYSRRLKKLASQLVTHQHIFVIGKGLHYPTALEIALKIKESSYLHAEGFPAGELKHGVIALIEEGTPCLVIDDGQEEIISSAMELKARGAYIIGLSPHHHPVFDYHLPLPDILATSPLHAVVPGQLLGAYLAFARGINPDTPRNLAKSVTVK